MCESHQRPYRLRQPFNPWPRHHWRQCLESLEGVQFQQEFQHGIPRNVFVYDANMPKGTQPTLVAGFMQLGHTTGTEFYFCVEFCFTEPEPSRFRLINGDGNILPRDATIVPTGNYFVVSPSPFSYVLSLIDSGPCSICLSRPHSRGCSTPKHFWWKPRNKLRLLLF